MGVLQDISDAQEGGKLSLSVFDIVKLSVLGVVAIPLLWILIDYVRVLRLRQKLPPGPFPLPLFGNFFTISKYKPWIQFEQWAQYYNNPMTTIWQGHRPTIMCNDAWTISELLDKRANIYSSRPRMIAMGDIINATENNQVCLVYGDRWRLHRRLMHTAVGSQAVRPIRHIQAHESKILVRDLMEKPDDYVLSIERYSTSVVSIIGWGRRIDKINDYVGQMALKVMEGVDLIIPGLFIIESIPLLARLPKLLNWIYPWPQTVFQLSLHVQRYFAALSKEGTGALEDNFAKRLYREKEQNGLDDAEIATLTSNLIGGGVDTTSGTTIAFLLAMCAFPDVQQKAHEELDKVVGQDRVPDWNDENSLPYVKAIMSEALRWRTVTILGGIPHAPIQDDEYRGYLIPKGTSITGNVWAIHRNPRDFPEPDVFRPERFLGGLERPYPNKQGHNAFGWGRRVCSGQPLAEQGLFMTIATLLWAFDIRPGLDENGNELKLDTSIDAFTKSENMRAEPFKARFIPRSKDIAEIILKEATRASKELTVFDGETRLTMENVP
ncbi:cytochrome P450 [Exophiala viscosa]|uniref:Cytochrome P450 n=1 Tax=Exophiala viscosa TaxID=2486360 RepID=A0AAN6DSP9_9EURO|nr:cytochrome P450 [Exophiala viscosa]